MKPITKRPGRKSIPVDAARESYDRTGNWSIVADEIRREDGTKYLATSLRAAVRAADLGRRQ